MTRGSSVTNVRKFPVFQLQQLQTSPHCSVHNITARQNCMFNTATKNDNYQLNSSNTTKIIT